MKKYIASNLKDISPKSASPLSFLLLGTLCISSAHALVTGTGGTDFIPFQGNLQSVNTTLINPYSGESYVMSGVYYVGTETYDALGGTDFLNMTTNSDYLSPTLGGSPTIQSIEIISAGAGSDVINLAGTTYSVTVNGGDSGDLIWLGSGNDTSNAGNGNDIVNGGPGDDTLNGEAGDDRFMAFIGSGHDVIKGGSGNNTIDFGAGLRSSDLTVTRGPALGLSYLIAFGDLGDNLNITDIQSLHFSDGSIFSPESFISQVPLSSGIMFFISALGALAAQARRNRSMPT